VRANAPSKVKGFQRRRLRSTPRLAGSHAKPGSWAHAKPRSAPRITFWIRAAPLYAS